MMMGPPQKIFINDLLNHFRPKSTVLVIGAGGADYWRYIECIPCRTFVVDRRSILDCQNMVIHDVTNKLPFPNQMFDYVYISTVLEYVIDDLFVLKECNRVLKDTGVLLVHSSFYPDRLNIPIRIYTLKSLKDICLYTNFELTDYKYYGFFEYLFHKYWLTKYVFTFLSYYIKNIDSWYLFKNILDKLGIFLNYKSFTDVCLMSFKKTKTKFITYQKDN